jgi:hypothetical protein
MSGKTRYLLAHLPLVFVFSGKMRYLLTHFATAVPIQWQNKVSLTHFACRIHRHSRIHSRTDDVPYSLTRVADSTMAAPLKSQI